MFLLSNSSNGWIQNVTNKICSLMNENWRKHCSHIYNRCHTHWNVRSY